MTWEVAQAEAREAVVAHDETSPLERAYNVGDMLGAAGTFAGHYNDAHEDPYGDTDMFSYDQE
jgi:hypothetical protein